MIVLMNIQVACSSMKRQAYASSPSALEKCVRKYMKKMNLLMTLEPWMMIKLDATFAG